MLKRKSKGEAFTFIELLITVAIFSIVMIVVYSAFAMGLSTYQRFKDVNLQKRTVMLRLEKMAGELRQSLNFTPQRRKEMVFKGEKKTISFPSLFFEEVVLVSYSFDSAEKVLYRQQESEKEVLSEEKESPLPKKFLSGIEDIEFSYYVFDEQKQEYQWKESYEGRLPLSVKIKITFGEELYTKIVSLPCAYKKEI